MAWYLLQKKLHLKETAMTSINLETDFCQFLQKTI